MNLIWMISTHTSSDFFVSRKFNWMLSENMLLGKPCQGCDVVCEDILNGVEDWPYGRWHSHCLKHCRNRLYCQAFLIRKCMCWSLERSSVRHVRRILMLLLSSFEVHSHCPHSNSSPPVCMQTCLHHL